jgi:hypothetical protein
MPFRKIQSKYKYRLDMFAPPTRLHIARFPRGKDYREKRVSFVIAGTIFLSPASSAAARSPEGGDYRQKPHNRK